MRSVTGQGFSFRESSVSFSVSVSFWEFEVEDLRQEQELDEPSLSASYVLEPYRREISTEV